MKKLAHRPPLSPAGLVAVAVLVASLAMAVFGASTVLERQRRTLVTSGSIEGLQVELARARWVENQMDHGGTFGVPASMMPDMPDHETHQRLTVDLWFFNPSESDRRVGLDQFHLETDAGLDLPVSGSYIGELTLGPGQGFSNALSFDYPLSHDATELRLVWRQRDREIHMPVPPLPDHRHFEEVLGLQWPDSYLELDRVGRPAKGLQLYAEKYGCAACHGQPENPGSQSIGPSLTDVPRRASMMLGGKGEVGPYAAEQYIYESLLRPDEHIASTCGPENRPCETPSAMPPYGDLLTREDMAHLVAYLMTQDSSGV